LLPDPPVLHSWDQPTDVVLGSLLATTLGNNEVTQVLLNHRFAFHGEADQRDPERQIAAETLPDEPDRGIPSSTTER
jgi:hypothetical protein